MKLSEKLLNRLADELPPGRQILSVAEEGPGAWTVALTVDRADVVGCVVWEMVMRREGAEPWNALALKAQSERIAESVTGLLEPLKLLEVDHVRLEALLRSDGPTRRGEDVFFYEVKLHAGNIITLRRFHASTAPGMQRDQVPFTLTHEAIACIVDDFKG
jgi:hypothetical protein